VHLVDERKLNELFRAAVPQVPPSTFDHEDIAAESSRQRTRRTALLGGSAIGLAILAGAAVLGVALWKGTGGTENGSAGSAAAPMIAGSSSNAVNAPNEVPNGDAESSGGASDRSVSAESPKQGGTPSGSTPRGCEQADPELAAALAGELRAAAHSSIPTDQSGLPAKLPCPSGGRGVAFGVDGGIVSLVVLPKDAQLTDPLDGQPSTAALRATSTVDGRHVILVSAPSGTGTAPFEATLQDIVVRLAARF
jgi:hypothetical protein